MCVPKYKKSIEAVITPEEFKEIWARCNTDKKKLIMGVLYLTGARPIELINLTPKDFTMDEEKEWVTVRLPTAKLGTAKGFVIRDRRLEIKKDAGDGAMGWIYDYVKQWNPEVKLIPGSETDRSRIKQIVYETTANKYCPYSFRHSRMTALSRGGADVSELMLWKGAKSSGSVDAYLQAKALGRRLTIE